MKVITHDKMRQPQKIKATRVVIEDDFGNPIGVFIQVEPNHIIAEIADNEERFNALLRQLGINKTLVIDTIKSRPPQV
jgi:ribosomal protein L16/L10AE